MTDTNSTTKTIDGYLAAYSEPDATRRRAMIAEVFATDATVADPPLDAAGRDGIDEMFAAVQQQFADHTFRRSSGVDAHHDAARYEWELVAADETISVAGTDFARFEDNGLISSIVGFFGPIPNDA